MRKTKIVCTIGPATDDETILRQMIKKGMDVARLNFSHGTHEEQLERVTGLRNCERAGYTSSHPHGHKGTGNSHRQI